MLNSLSIGAEEEHGTTGTFFLADIAAIGAFW